MYNTIFAEAYPDTLFISSGGNTELDQRSAVAIAILGKVFSNLEIWVLKDRDMASGKPTSEKDRILYLQNNEDNHRVLRRWEIENYLYDKEVLQKYCTHNALVFNESAYDAFVQDIDNQNLKDETAKIKNFCGITSGINPEKFKLSLSDFVSPDMKVYQDLAASIFLRQ
ncbi:hypothetical protein MAE02_17150 [Microvirga aerophila]|uniref:DUF4435 domain-containing protein n=1 Tax=Microvirga aerophila TaxID=670291 RepID=A0A512BPZ3_9HYPH|nr:hypothetical protein MAE02_17150 [Microvirga aerophila]